MTKIPTESWNITGITGPDYQVGPYCSVPGCHKIAEHGHHIVRKSFLAGDYKWVRMPDGLEFQNLTGLCVPHHEQVTVNTAEITYDDGVFYWSNGLTHNQLTQQPAMLGVAIEEASGQDSERPVCPTCNRTLPKPKIDTPPEEKRVRGTFGISIPVDERENGYDVLTELIEGCRDKLDRVGISYSEGSKAIYFVVSTTLALFIQHADAVLGDS